MVLDDSSRFILAGGEFQAATSDNSIDLVRKAIDDFGEIRMIKEVIIDHGSQFFANKTDNNTGGGRRRGCGAWENGSMASYLKL